MRTYTITMRDPKHPTKVWVKASERVGGYMAVETSAGWSEVVKASTWQKRQRGFAEAGWIND